MKLICGRSNEELSKKISEYLDIKLVDMKLSKFSDGEISCEVLENVRGNDCYVIQTFDSSDSIMSLFIIGDALKRASCGRITAVVPYYGYARQDRKSRSRTPITAKLLADLITASGYNRVITMDLHAGQIQGFFNLPVDDLFARKTFIEDIKKQDLEDICIVSPDAGGAPRARSIAKPFNASLAIIDKRREKANHSEVMHVIGDVTDKDCIIVDDIADTCGTLTNAASALKKSGAKSVRAYITHGVLSGPAAERILDSQIQELVVTDTIYYDRTSKINTQKIRTVTVSEVFAEAIRRVHNNESVSNLFI
jgi:ribose-phosphate pyrophosphokinase